MMMNKCKLGAAAVLLLSLAQSVSADRWLDSKRMDARLRRRLASQNPNYDRYLDSKRLEARLRRRLAGAFPGQQEQRSSRRRLALQDKRKFEIRVGDILEVSEKFIKDNKDNKDKIEFSIADQVEVLNVNDGGMLIKVTKFQMGPGYYTKVTRREGCTVSRMGKTSTSMHLKQNTEVLLVQFNRSGPGARIKHKDVEYVVEDYDKNFQPIAMLILKEHAKKFKIISATDGPRKAEINALTRRFAKNAARKDWTNTCKLKPWDSKRYYRLSNKIEYKVTGKGTGQTLVLAPKNRSHAKDIVIRSEDDLLDKFYVCDLSDWTYPYRPFKGQKYIQKVTKKEYKVVEGQHSQTNEQSIQLVPSDSRAQDGGMVVYTTDADLKANFFVCHPSHWTYKYQPWHSYKHIRKCNKKEYEVLRGNGDVIVLKSKSGTITMTSEHDLNTEFDTSLA